MARRSKLTQFAEGFGIGQKIAEAVNEAEMKDKLSTAASIGQTEGVTAAMTEQPVPEGMVYDDDTGQYLPKFDANAQVTEGQSVVPDQAMLPKFDSTVTPEYGLAGVKRATPFSQAEVEAARNRSVADVYMGAGRPEDAMKYRSQAANLEQQGLQAEAAKLQIDEAKRKLAGQEEIAKIAGRLSVGSDIGAVGGEAGILDAARGYAKDRNETLTPEQEGAIAKTYGAYTDPGIRYFQQLQLADAYRRQGNEASANHVIENAKTDIGGQALSAIESRNGLLLEKTARALGIKVSNPVFSPDGSFVSYANPDGTRGQIAAKSLEDAILTRFDPKGALAIRRAEQQSAAEKARQDARDSALNLQYAKLAQSIDRSSGGAGGTRSQSGSQEGQKVTDFGVVDALKKVGAFKDDATQGQIFDLVTATTRIAEGAKGPVGPDRVVEFAKLGMLYNDKRDQLLKANQDMTEAQIQDAIAPTSLNPATGGFVRMFDAGRGVKVQYGTPVGEAPQFIQQMRLGSGESALKEAITRSMAGKLSADEAADWNAGLMSRMSGLNDAQKKEVLSKWGSEGLATRYGSFAKPEQPKPTATSAKPAEFVPTAEQKRAAEALGIDTGPGIIGTAYDYWSSVGGANREIAKATPTGNVAEQLKAAQIAQARSDIEILRSDASSEEKKVAARGIAAIAKSFGGEITSLLKPDEIQAINAVTGNGLQKLGIK